MYPKKDKFPTIIFLTAIILVAGLFYWQNNKQKNPSDNFPYQGGYEEKTNKLPETSENEQIEKIPFSIKGEISQGNPNKKQIIFTFDAGSGINSTQKILETTKKHNVKITFFITGKFAEKNTELIKQIDLEGHEIFNHTYSHPHLTQLSDEQIKEELSKAEQTLNSLTGTTTKPYFRPPYKERDERVLKITQEIGYQSVVWTIDALDWMSDKTEEDVKNKIYSGLKPGAIILMHVGDDITGNVLEEIFTKIKNQGYSIVSLSEGLKS